ncbi:MAG TPA: hypothetical protein VL523_14335 [Terriglobia bacterium]|nr:hypothetical protein [Terriglobia bacterium]
METQPGAEADFNEALKGAPGFKYTSEDPMHGKIVLKLKDRVRELFQAAVENPDSDANEIVQILLLNQVTNMQAESYQRDPRLVLTEERQRGSQHKRQLEHDQRDKRRLDALLAKTRKETVRLNKQIEKLDQELQAGKMKLEQAKGVMNEAAAAQASGRPMDPQEVYRKIFEIVGLQEPVREERMASVQ